MTKRKIATLYHADALWMRNTLQEILGTRCEVIHAYRNKQSFGDCDILCVSDNLRQDAAVTIANRFKLDSDQISRNGDCVSFVHDEFQYDVIFVPQSGFRNAYDYYAYNDLGNLLGRLMHKLGIKYGHKGLSIVVRAPDNQHIVLGEIELYCENTKVIVKDILGLPRTYDFIEVEDIFKYVALSSYFDPDIFLLDNRSSISRKRDEKRKTYSLFLEWCEETKPKRNYDFSNKSERGGYGIREPFFTDIVLRFWPEVKCKIDELLERYEFNKQFARVYNGNIVNELTELEGKDLARFMSMMREHLTDERKRSWIQFPDKAKIGIINFHNDHIHEFVPKL